MTSDVATIALSAAFVMGLAGSAHCFGMCGGLASAFAMRFRHSADSGEFIRHTLLQQAARIFGYAVLGAICGAAGQALQAVLDFASVGQFARVVSGVVLLLVAARMLLRWNVLAPVEKAGARVWKKVQPLTLRLPNSGLARTFAFGFAWGLLPCGMVYSMLAFAASSASALHGATLMLAFGLGTVPAMIGSVFAAAKATRSVSSPWLQRASGTLLACFGVWLILAPLIASSHAGHLH